MYFNFKGLVGGVLALGIAIGVALVLIGFGVGYLIGHHITVTLH